MLALANKKEKVLVFEYLVGKFVVSNIVSYFSLWLPPIILSVTHFYVHGAST